MVNVIVVVHYYGLVSWLHHGSLSGQLQYFDNSVTFRIKGNPKTIKPQRHDIIHITLRFIES